jgi:queuine tRNA-ribosyltransferase
MFVAGEILGPVLATHHNLHFYCETMRRMRTAIREDRFESWRREFTGRYQAGEDERVRRNQHVN